MLIARQSDSPEFSYIIGDIFHILYSNYRAVAPPNTTAPSAKTPKAPVPTAINAAIHTTEPININTFMSKRF